MHDGNIHNDYPPVQCASDVQMVSLWKRRNNKANAWGHFHDICQWLKQTTGRTNRAGCCFLLKVIRQKGCARSSKTQILAFFQHNPPLQWINLSVCREEKAPLKPTRLWSRFCRVASTVDSTIRAAQWSNKTNCENVDRWCDAIRDKWHHIFTFTDWP